MCGAALCWAVATVFSTAHATPALRLEPLATGLTAPVAVTHADDGSGRLFITLRDGKILIHHAGRVRPKPFLDLTPLVSATPGWEDGLFSVAFHPNYRSNGYFYVDYVDHGNNIVVARY